MISAVFKREQTNEEECVTIRKIIAPLTGSERDRVVLASAFSVARLFQAHVVALFVRPDPAEAMPFFSEGVSSVVVQEVISVANEVADKAAEAARATLRDTAASAGVIVTEEPGHTGNASVSFREVQGNFTDCVNRAARLSDLIVFGPLSEGDKPGLTEAFEETLIDTGRPVLLSANAPSQTFGRKIALAWDGSLACAHAVSASLPLLSQAGQIELLSVRRGAARDSSPAELHEYLKLHGLAFTDRTIDTETRQVGEVLLETAVAGRADLMVIGGYGHSRLREFFAGGVTRHIVSHATIPLFLVH